MLTQPRPTPLSPCNHRARGAANIIRSHASSQTSILALHLPQQPSRQISPRVRIPQSDGFADEVCILFGFESMRSTICSFLTCAQGLASMPPAPSQPVSLARSGPVHPGGMPFVPAISPRFFWKVASTPFLSACL